MLIMEPIMRILTYQDLDVYGHDVCELCYSEYYLDKKHWHMDSIYVPWDDKSLLSKYIDKIFDKFHYFGPQIITYDEWKMIENMCLVDNPNEKDFFEKVNNWLKSSVQNAWFIYYGV